MLFNANAVQLFFFNGRGLPVRAGLAGRQSLLLYYSINTAILL